MRLKGIGAVQKHVGTGADPEFLCEGGKGEGLILSWFGRGYEILRVKEEDVSGVWGEAPAAFYPLLL